ncbi:Eukaryotic translation initiation factor 3 subunit H [Nymphon striatum]|nr:Eukaryotic translation initiation factor 3 subunit H [Nymphon striatum]
MASASASGKRDPEDKKPVDYVQIDGLVVLKIIKHCQEEGAGTVDVVQGVLLGLEREDKKLEITNCFPFPRHAEDEDFDEVEYQMEMMRHLRQVNIDHLHVGWYQSMHQGGCFNKALLDSQFCYQNSIKESVVLIYDPMKTNRGFLSLKAYRLSYQAMQLYKDQDFSSERLKSVNLDFKNMFEEIKVVIRNSHLINSLLCEISETIPEEQGFHFFDLATSTVMEKNLRALMDCVEEMNQEANKYCNILRQTNKQNQAKQQHIHKRQTENAARQSRGEPALPDEDINKIFKPIPLPSRLDSLLYSGQILNHCQLTSEFASQSLGKLFVVESLQKEKQ